MNLVGKCSQNSKLKRRVIRINEVNYVDKILQHKCANGRISVPVVIIFIGRRVLVRLLTLERESACIYHIHYLVRLSGAEVNDEVCCLTLFLKNEKHHVCYEDIKSAAEKDSHTLHLVIEA